MYVPNTPPQPEYWVLSLSGGKDSTALGLEWLKRHQQDPVTYPLHEVIYCDTGMEFPAMVEHINRLEQIFTGAGIKFTRLKSEKSFEYLMFEYQPKKKNPELQHLKGKSWPTSKVRWCTGELKQKIVSRYFTHAQLAWYTHSEVRTEELQTHECTPHKTLRPFTHAQLGGLENKSIRKEMTDGTVHT